MSLNRKLVESYRDPMTGNPRNSTVKKLGKAPYPGKSRLILEYGGGKHLRDDEWRALNKSGDFKLVSSQNLLPAYPSFKLDMTPARRLAPFLRRKSQE